MNEAPFAKTYVSLTKQEYIQLKWNTRFYKRQHERAIERIAELKQQLENSPVAIALSGLYRKPEFLKIGKNCACKA